MKFKYFAFILSVFFLFSCATTNVSHEEFIVSEKANFVCRYRLPKDYSKADSYRTDKPYPEIVSFVNNNETLRKKSIDKYVDSLCELIKTKAKNDFEKAKMVHDFAAYLLPYDYNSLNGNRKWQDWRAVIHNKTGVCEGYARVFEELCTRVGLQCLYVSGFAGRMGSNTGHAWNIVQCEKEWYLVDPTWDSYVNSKTGTNEVITKYLFPRPENFILTHYPTGYETENGSPIGSSYVGDYHLQLLPNPLTESEHTKLLSIREKEAITYSSYDEIFEDFYTNISRDVYIGKDIKLNYKLKPNKKIWMVIYQKKYEKIYGSYNPTTNDFFKIPYLRKGTYTAVIYGCDQNQNYGNPLIEFIIHAGAPESKWNVSPTGGIHTPINFGVRSNLYDYTDSETDENADFIPEPQLTGTIHQFDLYKAAKKLNFIKNPYSPQDNPTIATDIATFSLLKMKNVKSGDIIRFKGKIKATDSLTNMTAIFYDPDPSHGYWKEITPLTIIIPFAEEEGIVEFSQDFVVICKPKTELRIQFSLNKAENDGISSTKVTVLPLE